MDRRTALHGAYPLTLLVRRIFEIYNGLGIGVREFNCPDLLLFEDPGHC